MQFLVDTYKCEWKEVVNDPEKRRLFKQFANTDETEPSIEFVTERGQQRPADWPTDFVPLERAGAVRSRRTRAESRGTIVRRGGCRSARCADFPLDGGGAIKYGKSQIAVFNFASRGEWYACQNMCPHKQEFVLSRGIIGDQDGVPKVACPLHKKTFSLESGTCLSGEDYQVQVFPVKVEADACYLDLPAERTSRRCSEPRDALRDPVCCDGGGEKSDYSTTSIRSPMSDEFSRLPPRRPYRPTLFSAFLYFDISFMVWVLLGALANSIVPDFGLSDSQKGLMVAVPLLGGAMLRLVLGRADRPHRGRRTGILGMGLTIDPAPAGLAVGRQLRPDAAGRACCWASPGPASPPRCRWPAAGIRRDTRGWRWGSPARAIAAPPWPPSSARGWRRRWGWHAVFGLALVPLLADAVVFMPLRQGQPRAAGAPTAGRLRRGAPAARHLVVLPVLLGHVRRLRGSGQLPERLLPRASMG